MSKITNLRNVVFSVQILSLLKRKELKTTKRNRELKKVSGNRLQSGLSLILFTYPAKPFIEASGSQFLVLLRCGVAFELSRKEKCVFQPCLCVLLSRGVQEHFSSLPAQFPTLFRRETNKMLNLRFFTFSFLKWSHITTLFAGSVLKGRACIQFLTIFLTIARKMEFSKL